MHSPTIHCASPFNETANACMFGSESARLSQWWVPDQSCAIMAAHVHWDDKCALSKPLVNTEEVFNGTPKRQYKYPSEGFAVTRETLVQIPCHHLAPAASPGISSSCLSPLPRIRLAPPSPSARNAGHLVQSLHAHSPLVCVVIYPRGVLVAGRDKRSSHAGPDLPGIGRAPFPGIIGRY